MRIPSRGRRGVIRLLLVLLPLLPQAALGTDYYVSAANGDDGDTGRNEAEAWRTIGKANAEATAGDVIHIKGGAKPYPGQIVPQRGGKKDAPITYRGYRETRPVLVGDGTSVCIRLAGKRGVERIVIRNIHCDGGTEAETGFRAFVVSWASSHNEFRNNAFTGWVKRNPVTFGTPREGRVAGIGSSYNTFVNNRVEPGGPGMRFGHGPETLLLQGSSGHNLIEDNRITDGGHNVIQVRSSFNVIRGNELMNPEHRAIEVDGDEKGRRKDPAEHNVFERNVIRSSGGSNEANAFQLWSARNIIRHNLFYGNTDDGLNISRPPEAHKAPDLRDNRVYHNVFYRNGLSASGKSQRFGIFVWVRAAEGQDSGNAFVNNVFYRNRMGSPIQMELRHEKVEKGPFGTLIAHNAIRNEKAGEEVLRIQGHPAATLEFYEERYPEWIYHNQDVAPGFVDAPSGNFELRSESPLIDAGGFLTRVVEGSTTGSLATEVRVADVLYFSDGNGIVDGDVVQFGASGETRRVRSVDYRTDTLVLDAPIRASRGEAVSLPWKGSRPDIGAHEWSSEEASVPSRPTVTR